MDVIEILVYVLLFGAFIGTIATQVSVAENHENVTGIARTIMPFITVFVVIGTFVYVGRKAKVMKGR